MKFGICMPKVEKWTKCLWQMLLFFPYKKDNSNTKGVVALKFQE